VTGSSLSRPALESHGSWQQLVLPDLVLTAQGSELDVTKGFLCQLARDHNFDQANPLGEALVHLRQPASAGRVELWLRGSGVGLATASSFASRILGVNLGDPAQQPESRHIGYDFLPAPPPWRQTDAPVGWGPSRQAAQLLDPLDDDATRPSLERSLSLCSLALLRAWPLDNPHHPATFSQRLELFLWLTAALWSGLGKTDEERAVAVGAFRDSTLRRLVLAAGQGEGKLRECSERLESHATTVPDSWRDLEPPSAVAELVGALSSVRALLSRRSSYQAPEASAWPTTPFTWWVTGVFHILANMTGLHRLNRVLAAQALLVQKGAGAFPIPRTLKPASSVYLAPQLEARHAAGDPCLRAVADQVAIPFDFDHRYRWSTLLGATHPASVAWLANYSALGWPIVELCQQAVRLARARDLEAAGIVLEQARKRFNQLSSPLTSIPRVVARFLKGAEAYSSYCQGEIDQALDDLEAGESAVRSAVLDDEGLIPIAVWLLDFPTKRARLYRELGDWQSTAEELRVLSELRADLQPLVVLASGEAVFHSTIAARVRESGPVDPQAHESLAFLEDESVRLRDLESFVRSLAAPRSPLLDRFL
jgi:hypothetical protein